MDYFVTFLGAAICSLGVYIYISRDKSADEKSHPFLNGSLDLMQNKSSLLIDGVEEPLLDQSVEGNRGVNLQMVELEVSAQEPSALPTSTEDVEESKTVDDAANFIEAVLSDDIVEKEVAAIEIPKLISEDKIIGEPFKLPLNDIIVTGLLGDTQSLSADSKVILQPLNQGFRNNYCRNNIFSIYCN